MRRSILPVYSRPTLFYTVFTPRAGTSLFKTRHQQSSRPIGRRNNAPRSVPQLLVDLPRVAHSSRRAINLSHAGAVYLWVGDIYVDGNTVLVNNSAGLDGGERGTIWCVVCHFGEYPAHETA